MLRARRGLIPGPVDSSGTIRLTGSEINREAARNAGAAPPGGESARPRRTGEGEPASSLFLLETLNNVLNKVTRSGSEPIRQAEARLVSRPQRGMTCIRR